MNRFPVENVDKVNSAKVADKATSDSDGKNIVSTYLKLLGTYIKNLSISGKNITVTHGDGTTSTLTTQDTTYSLPTGNASTIGGLKLSDSTSSTSSTTGGIAATPKAVKSAYDLANTTKNNSITGLSVSGKTITYTKGDGTTGTITTQDTNTTYSAATASDLGLVKIGSNITVSSGTISLTKSNVTTALGYTPPTTNTTYSTGTASTAGLTKLYTSTGTSTDGTMTRAAITSALSSTSSYPQVAMAHYNKWYLNCTRCKSDGTSSTTGSATYVKLPSGGTWYYIIFHTVAVKIGSCHGGSILSLSQEFDGTTDFLSMIAIRIA